MPKITWLSTLKEKKLPVKIIAWDHNKERLYANAGVYFSGDSVIAGGGFHWYSGDHFEQLQMTAEDYPDKFLLFTEGCVEYSRYERENSVRQAEMYAHDMIGNFNHGCCGFFLRLEPVFGRGGRTELCGQFLRGAGDDQYKDQTDPVSAELLLYRTPELLRKAWSCSDRMLKIHGSAGCGGTPESRRESGDGNCKLRRAGRRCADSERRGDLPGADAATQYKHSDCGSETLSRIFS